MTVSPHSLPWSLPPIEPDGIVPIWDGMRYQIGTDFTTVLEYGFNQSGWNDVLTSFHEDTAGSDHFIDVASRDHALSQVKKYISGKSPVLLEIGCSSGFMLKQLAQNNVSGTTIGADIVKEPLEQLAKNLPGIPLLRFDLLKCPLPDNSIDALVALNVLEHIENDLLAVKQLFRILRPGAVAIIEVPAGPELYDNYDRMLKHFRRYEIRGLKSLFVQAGFKVEEASHLGCFIYPGFWAVKQLSKLRTKGEIDENAVKASIGKTRGNPLMKVVTDIELTLGKHLLYPFGIRCLLTCSKP